METLVKWKTEEELPITAVWPNGGLIAKLNNSFSIEH
jgi:hypothetical protein